MGADKENNLRGKDAITEDVTHINNPSLAKDAFSALCADVSSKFVTCHRYTSSTVTTSSPAHWHKEIEIMHFLSGKGFIHTCQCHGETFDAPAIIIVPSNLIHRTRYSPHCKVNRVLFNGEHVRLHENDKALEQALSFLKGGDGRGSIVIRENDAGFQKLTEILSNIENLSDPCEDNTFDPTKAQEVSIQQDRMDAFVSANFVNTGSAQALASQIESLNQYQEEQRALKFGTRDPAKGDNIAEALALATADDHRKFLDDSTEYTEEFFANCPYVPSLSALQHQSHHSDLGADIVADEEVVNTIGTNPLKAHPARRASAINAGSIAIALAHNFEEQDSTPYSSPYQEHYFENAGISRLNHRELLNCHMMGLTLQFKAHLISLLGALFEFGYLMETRTQRRPRLARYNDDRIKLLLKHIHDNYNHSMNIGELASMLQVTNQYFCRYFKQLTDMSFIDYLNDLRLQKAAVEIATTQQSIREISARHGFETIGYFFKLFRERYHMTPINYRNHILEKCKTAEREYLSSKSSDDAILPPHLAMAAPFKEPRTRRRRSTTATTTTVRKRRKKSETTESSES